MRTKLYRLALSLSVAGVASAPLPALAQSYAITWFTVDGGGGASAGVGYAVSGTAGQPDAGSSSGGAYTLGGGFWSGSGPFASITMLVSSQNPQTYGQPVTFTATVTPSVATGSVTFKDGASALGTQALVSGMAGLTTSALSVGSHAITAEYGGDASYLASMSSTLTQEIAKIATATVLASSSNPVRTGNPLTLTASVSPSTAGGTVMFKVGASMLGTGTLAGGVAQLATTSLPVGTKLLTAEYAGDAGHGASASASLVQIVNLDSSPRPGDATGDSLGDVLIRRTSGEVRLLQSTGTAFDSSQWTNGFVSYRYDVYYSDVDGDGRSDLISRSKDTGDVEVFKSTGSAFTYSAGTGPGGVWSYGWGTTYDLYFADVTGDGKADLIGRHSGNGDVIVFSSTGSGFTFAAGPGPGGTWSYGWSSGYDLFFGDVTGDGKADLVSRYFGPTAGLTGDIYVAISTGSGFTFNGRWTYGFSAGYNIYVGDMDGDGKADLLARYFGPTEGLTGDVYVIYSDGTQFTWRGNFNRWTYGWGSTYEIVVRDVTGDGRADFIGRHTGNGEIVVATSTGTALTFQGTWATMVDTGWDIR